jgi:hypothetical protein
MMFHLPVAAMRKKNEEMQLDSFLPCADSVKAFDACSRPVIEALLKKCDVPDNLINVINVLHANNAVQCVDDDGNEATMNQTGGVKQGDPMASLLFPFTIDAW